MDKALHFGGYAPLGIFFFRTFSSLPMAISTRRAMVIGMIASVLYGISDEIHQHYVPSRNADVFDGVADGLGSIFGIFLYEYGWVKRKRKGEISR